MQNKENNGSRYIAQCNYNQAEQFHWNIVRVLLAKMRSFIGIITHAKTIIILLLKYKLKN